jgi:cytosine/adenosine deaminase-related metal-dependent hydrolase
MIIRGVEIVGGGAGPHDIALAGARIDSVEPATGRAPDSKGDPLGFRDAIAFPGLMNSHDHLEFNLYPRLGHGHYADYVEWGREIHRRDRELIASIEAVPRSYRARWGVVKNLLCGVTSVGHHGEPFDSTLSLPIEPLGGTAIHSIGVDSRWRRRLNSPANRPPFVLHIGEGTSSRSHREIERVIRWNLLRRDLIAVHAITMDAEQAARFRAVVWCPQSNQFLYGRTADVRSLKERTTVLFGTDSTLTADWNIWNHLRSARELGVLTSRELFEAVTRSAAEAWRRPNAGRLAPGSRADLVVAQKKTSDPWDAFFAVNPEDILLIVRNGIPILIDGSLELAPLSRQGWRVGIGGSQKIIVENVPELMRNIRERGVEPNIDLGSA